MSEIESTDDVAEPSCEELQDAACDFYSVKADDPHVAAYAFRRGREFERTHQMRAAGMPPIGKIILGEWGRLWLPTKRWGDGWERQTPAGFWNKCDPPDRWAPMPQFKELPK